MWLFVVFETLLFTSYFCVYLYLPHPAREAFLGPADLDLRSASSTRSSCCSARGRSRAACRPPGRATTPPALTDAYRRPARVVFLVLKIVEWVTRSGGGTRSPAANSSQHYFFLTRIHCIHLLIGFVVLGVLVYQLSGPARRSQQLIETCSTYWHTVDLFWVLIFALLYIVR